MIPFSRFLDDSQGSNGSSMMGGPGGNNTSWLFSSGNGGGFHDHLGQPQHQQQHQPQQPPTSNSTFTPVSAFEDGRAGSHPPQSMIPFSQTDLSFVDSLTIHPSQHKAQQQSQHFVTTSTLHPGSSLSVEEAAEAAGEDLCFFSFYLNSISNAC